MACEQLARTNNEQALNYLIDPDATYEAATDRSMFEEPVTAYVERLRRRAQPAIR
jgi:hypothetical protein